MKLRHLDHPLMFANVTYKIILYFIYMTEKNFISNFLLYNFS